MKKTSEIWFDPQFNSWVIIWKDCFHEQVGDCEYAPTKKAAIQEALNEGVYPIEVFKRNGEFHRTITQ